MRKHVTSHFFIILIVFISAIIPVFAADPANFNPVKGYEFMASKNENGRYENVITTAIAAIAFKDTGATAYAEQAKAWLEGQRDDTNNCWPKGNCKIKDTAFAIWAFNEFGEDTDAGEEWLKSMLIPALKNNWYLEIITTNNGVCKISYPGADGRQEEDIQVDAGTFPQCTVTPTNTFFDLNQCLRTKNLVETRSSIDFDINCADLGPSSIISIIFNTQNSYSLVQQATTDRYQAVINNGCFSDNPADRTCSKDASLFTNWILAQVAASANVDIWLKTVYDTLKPLDNALFILAKKDNTQNFVSSLSKAQRNDGSFNNDVYETAFAILALKKAGSTKELNAATEWLKTKQQSDGSWGSLQNTALALYTSFTNVPVTLPPPGGSSIHPPATRCGDDICGGDETFETCPQDCETRTSACNENNVCEIGNGEDSDNCSADCYCGDQVCDDYERSTGSCSTDCSGGQQEYCGNDIREGTEECDGVDDGACPGLCTFSCTCDEEPSSGSGKWIWILIIFILLGGAVFFYMKSKKGSKPAARSTQEFKPFTSQLEKTQPQQQQKWNWPSAGSSVKSKIEDDLDKSLEEAKKLLKKL